ncbi:phosphatidate cytidylyltransferase [Nematocida sp. AWRm77]|nr:phosphatidate cytidylyltransferase [Nematocida sp. AWRm77]
MHEKKKIKEKETGNMGKRVVLSFVLLFLFILSIKVGKACLLGVIVAISILVFSEFLKVLLGIKSRDGVPVLGEFISEKQHLVPVGFFWTCFVCLSLQKISDQVVLEHVPYRVTRCIPYLHLVWISWFILLLKGGMYRRKFFHVSLSIVWSLMIAQCTAAAINNLSRGVFYFVYPCSLVFVNDTAAYVVGKLVGQTPLSILSPKKTVEGFLGGGLLTFGASIPLAYLIRFIVGKEIELSFFQLHFLSLISAAIGPLGGLLASGYKRAFGVKHFSTLIPGHGGIMDRVDCQLVMQVFTNVYLSHLKRIKTIDHFQFEIEQKLSKPEKVSLILCLLENL